MPGGSLSKSVERILKQRSLKDSASSSAAEGLGVFFQVPSKLRQRTEELHRAVFLNSFSRMISSTHNALPFQRFKDKGPLKDHVRMTLKNYDNRTQAGVSFCYVCRAPESSNNQRNHQDFL